MLAGLEMTTKDMAMAGFELRPSGTAASVLTTTPPTAIRFEFSSASHSNPCSWCLHIKRRTFPLIANHTTDNIISLAPAWSFTDKGVKNQVSFFLLRIHRISSRIWKASVNSPFQVSCINKKMMSLAGQSPARFWFTQNIWSALVLNYNNYKPSKITRNCHRNVRLTYSDYDTASLSAHFTVLVEAQTSGPKNCGINRANTKIYSAGWMQNEHQLLLQNKSWAYRLESHFSCSAIAFPNCVNVCLFERV